MKKSFFILVVAFILSGCFHVKNISENTTGTLPVKTVAKGFNSLEKQKTELIIKSHEELKNLWNIIYATQLDKPPLPNIDFDTNIIIGIFLGEKPTAGFSIEVQKIMEENGKIIVYIEETSPPQDSFQAQIITEPYHVIQIPKMDKPVVYQYQ